MKLKIKEFNIYIDETILILIFLSIMFRGIRQYFENYFICFLFITFHEFSHMFIASIFGIKTTKLSICISGLSINLNDKNRKGLKWLFIFLAGPISNIILASTFNNIPMVYTINLALAIINLLPIYPLDGYNIFGIMLHLLKIKNVSKLQYITQNIVFCLLGIIGGYQLIILKNLSIILMVFYIFIQSQTLRKNSSSVMYQNCYKNITNFN